MEQYTPTILAFSGACHSGKTSSMKRLSEILKGEIIIHNEEIREQIPDGYTIDSIRQDPDKYLQLQFDIIQAKMDSEIEAAGSCNAIHIFDRSIYDSLFYYTFYVSKDRLSQESLIKYHEFYKKIIDHIDRVFSYDSIVFFKPYKNFQEKDSMRPAALEAIQDTEYDLISRLTDRAEEVVYIQSKDFLEVSPNEAVLNFLCLIPPLRINMTYAAENIVMNTYGSVIVEDIDLIEKDASILYSATMADKLYADAFNTMVLQEFPNKGGLVSHASGFLKKNNAMIVSMSAGNDLGTAIKENWLKPASYFGSGGRLLRKALFDHKMPYITNLCKYVADDKNISQKEYSVNYRFFENEVNYIDPTKIICLGEDVFEFLKETLPYTYSKRLILLKHPTYHRIQGTDSEFITMLQKELYL